jgi:deferrochelatase/peroxidase EfeB
MESVSQNPQVMVAAPMVQPVLSPLTASAILLVLTVDDGGEAEVRMLLEDLSGLVRPVSFRSPEAGLAVVAGIVSAAWDRLFSGPRPAELHPFKALHDTKHQAPSTSGDVLVHVRAAAMDQRDRQRRTLPARRATGRSGSGISGTLRSNQQQDQGCAMGIAR